MAADTGVQQRAGYVSDPSYNNGGAAPQNYDNGGAPPQNYNNGGAPPQNYNNGGPQNQYVVHDKVKNGDNMDDGRKRRGGCIAVFLACCWCLTWPCHGPCCCGL